MTHAALVPTTVRAGGLEVSDLGTVAAGRGGAFVARADNPSAFHHNPAGLAGQEGFGWLLSLNAFRLDLSFRRQGSGMPVQLEDGRRVRDPDLDYDRDAAFAEVSPSTLGSLGPSPMLALNWGGAFGIDGLALSAGLLPPSTVSGRDYPDEGPQRYAVGTADSILFYYGVGAAYQLTDDLSIGLTLLNGLLNTRISRPTRPLAQPDNEVTQNEDRYEDHTFVLDLSDYFVPAGSLGLLYQPTPYLALGLSVRSPVKIEARGQMGYQIPENPSFQDSYLATRGGSCAEAWGEYCPGAADLSAVQRFPLVVRAGARYLGERFDLEFDLIYENWKAASVQDVLPEGYFVQVQGDIANAPVPLPAAAVDRELRDVFSLRVGGDLQVIPGTLDLRAGAFHSPSAYPADFRTFNLDFPFASQTGLSVGASWQLVSQLSASVFYARIFQETVTVSDGKVQQLTATSPNLGNIVNNGRYEVGLDHFGLALEGTL